MRDKHLGTEVLLRLVIITIFIITDIASPFHRVLQPEELWLYRYPHTPSYYSGPCMWVTVLSVPVLVLVGFYMLYRDSEDFIQAALGVTMSVFGTGCVTNFVKLAVGRPRPDFLSRCYPDDLPDPLVFSDTSACTGNEDMVLEGLKSFPSGHASLSFSSLGFISLYIGGKLQVFSHGRGQGLRFVAFILPLLWALMIAVSRTSDYHHHWQDVTVGSILGLVMCYTCYRQVYPSLGSGNSHLCYKKIPPGMGSLDIHGSGSGSPSSPHTHSRDAEFKFVAKVI